MEHPQSLSPPQSGTLPIDFLRPAAPTLRAALTYIRVQAEAAETHAGALTREAGLFQEMAAAHRGHARHLEDLLFLMGEAA